jgi:hypothetical protein
MMPNKRVFEDKNLICLLLNNVYSIFDSVYRRVGGLETMGRRVTG